MAGNRQTFTIKRSRIAGEKRRRRRNGEGERLGGALDGGLDRDRPIGEGVKLRRLSPSLVVHNKIGVSKVFFQ